MDINQYSSDKYILIAGARLHNLKNITVAIPRNAFTVITGVSGSGKSTLAFDTLYAEGQRRYVESLSSYARQFLARLEKPEVDYIKGISPTVAIEQKVKTTNPRSTVGTSTELHELFKLLFARIGKIIHPETGEEIKQDETDDVIRKVLQFVGNKAVLFVEHNYIKDYSPEDLMAQGFSRVKQGDVFKRLEDVQEGEVFDLVLDRMEIKEDENFIDQLSDSVELAFKLGEGNCAVDIYKGTSVESLYFTKSLFKEGIEFVLPDLNLFNFNSPIGACPVCEGYGKILGISEELVIPDFSLSVYDGAVAPWNSPSGADWKKMLLKNAHHINFPVHTPYKNLSAQDKKILWKGCKHFEGIQVYFDYLQSKIYKIQNRVLISRYKGRTDCTSCEGSKLRKEALYIKVGDKHIGELDKMTIEEAYEFFTNLILNPREHKIAERIVTEIIHRLTILKKVGVQYLQINRGSATLSGGESQRINLASMLGNNLMGATYILDEPSIGLHPKDTENLIEVIRLLNQAGNTVIVVEHDEEIIKSAGYVIDIGPKAGRLGGEVVYQGSKNVMLQQNTLTAQYLSGAKKVSRNPIKMYDKGYKIHLKKSYKNNLKIDEVSFPLYSFTVVCGVSGSGKSTLVLDELIPELKLILNNHDSDRLKGSLNLIKNIEYVDQNPIGRSSRSNPVTYVKAFDDIRAMFASLPLSNIRNYEAKHFSLNVPGGRCEKCAGEGEITVEMQFMADIKIKCEECGGKKYQKEILDVLYKEHSIYDILNLTIDEAIELFKGEEKKGRGKSYEEKILEKLIPLQKVGLGYVQLGQSSNTLSGGEAQRVKLAYFLIKGNSANNTLFVFDEPTTGLHFEDVNLLLQSFNELLLKENHLVVIEHNTDVIACADYVIEIGPEGGDKGGNLVFEGTVEDMKKSPNSLTKKWLK